MMELDRRLLLAHCAAHALSVMAGLLVVVPLALNGSAFKGRCALFTQGFWRSENQSAGGGAQTLVVQQWGPPAACQFATFVGVFTVLYGATQSWRSFFYLHRRHDESECDSDPRPCVLVQHRHRSQHSTLQLCRVPICAPLFGCGNLLILLRAQLCTDLSVVCNRSVVGSLHSVLPEALPLSQSADQRTVSVPREGAPVGSASCRLSPVMPASSPSPSATTCHLHLISKPSPECARICSPQIISFSWCRLHYVMEA